MWEWKMREQTAWVEKANELSVKAKPSLYSETALSYFFKIFLSDTSFQSNEKLCNHKNIYMQKWIYILSDSSIYTYISQAHSQFMRN